MIDHLISLAKRSSGTLPEAALSLAKASLFDWLLCGRAGINEPVAQKMHSFAGTEGLTGPASIFGGGLAPARMAALVNGATSHALDYDDTHFDHVGHLSVAIYPAALAVGEETDATLSQVIEAFLVGAETAIHVGCTLGAAHYNRGFHQTATAGAFGATIAAARLRNLSEAQIRYALGLCATRASGLRSQFGTMGKPFNAGIAASNGVEVSALAALGLTSADDGIMGALGFVPTHSDAPETPTIDPNQFRFMRNSYKFHACCHGTHAMIEALSTLKREHNFDVQEVASIELRTSPRWLSVCNIATPRTGLEVKFSYRWLAAMVMYGLPTADNRAYTDDLANDPDLAKFAATVAVVADTTVGDQQAKGTLILKSGETLHFAHDLAHQPTIEELTQRLTTKAHAILKSDAEVLVELREKFDSSTAREIGVFVRSDGAP